MSNYIVYTTLQVPHPVVSVHNDGFMEYNKWYDMTLSKSVGELVLTCTSAKDIWDKLCARFECSSTQWLNMLFESFFQAQHDCKEDISTHVAKLQKRLST